MKDIIFFSNLLFLSLTGYTQQSVTINGNFHMAPDAEMAVFSDININGNLSTRKGIGTSPKVYFMGIVWKNNPTTANLAPNPETDPGGEFYFIRPNQVIQGGSTSLSDENSYFPNITVDNSSSVTLRGSEGCKNNFAFISGKMVLDTSNFTVGHQSSRGNLTGHSPNNYFVVSSSINQTAKGYLVRYSDGKTIPFPVGNANSYDPVSLKHQGGFSQQMKVRVFPGAGQNGYDVMDRTYESCGKTWDITPTGTAPIVDISLAHNISQEGSSYTAAASLGFITRFVGSAPNSAGGQTSYSKWDRLPSTDPSIGAGVNATITTGTSLSTHSQHTRNMVDAFGLFSKAVQTDVTPMLITTVQAIDENESSTTANTEINRQPEIDFRSIQAFPNPTTGILQIRSSQIIGAYQLQDASGKILLKGNITSTEGSISLFPFAPGLYYLIVQQTIQKIIKTN